MLKAKINRRYLFAYGGSKVVCHQPGDIVEGECAAAAKAEGAADPIRETLSLKNGVKNNNSTKRRASKSS